jgi:nucleoside-diphosphate-sugar epimerase
MSPAPFAWQSEGMHSPAERITVIGANGFVGSALCHALAERGALVRGVVRRAGAAPALAGVEEMVGDFTDPDTAAEIASGTATVVTTVHPMGSDRATQHEIGVEGTVTLARAAAAAGVTRLIHVSTCAVYDRAPEMGDIDESSPLVPDDADDYAVTKRDADLALANVAGPTRVLVRPPAILGPGPSSVWNSLRPAAMRERETARHAVAKQTFAWVHVTDLASFIADLATGQVPEGPDLAGGPLHGGCTAVNVAAPRATQRDYMEAVTGALGVDPVWDERPAWTAGILAERAHGWGWQPGVALDQALAELVAGVAAAAGD